MIEKLIDILTEPSKKKATVVLDILLWISLTVTSYNRCMTEINLSDISDWENQLTNGAYILFFIWVICFAFGYYLLYLLLNKIIPQSALATQFFIKIYSPIEYRQSLLNVYFRKAKRAGKEHLEVALKYLGEDTKENRFQKKKMIQILGGIVLKFALLIILMIGDYNGTELIIAVFGLVICLILLCYLILNLTKLDGKNILEKIIQDADII